MVDFDKKKAVADAIEATSGVLTSIKRQRQHAEMELARVTQFYDDLTKVEGWVKNELKQYVELKKSYDKEDAGG